MKTLKFLLCTLIINLILVGNAYGVNSNVHADSSVLHNGWSGEWGWKNYRIEASYYGNQYEADGKQYVDGHDYIVSILTAYSPEVPRGQVKLGSLQLLNSNDTAVSTLYQSSFSKGLIRSYFLDPAREYLCMICSYSWLQSTAGTYRVKVDTIYTNSSFIGMDGTDTAYSSYF